MIDKVRALLPARHQAVERPRLFVVKLEQDLVAGTVISANTGSGRIVAYPPDTGETIELRRNTGAS
jgi:hypothetical protein